MDTHSQYDPSGPIARSPVVAAAPGGLLEEFERRFRPFLEAELSPHAARWDADATPIPRELLAKAGALGLFAFGLPTHVGGEGRSPREWAALLRWLGRVGPDQSFPLLVSLFAGVAADLARHTHSAPALAHARGVACGGAFVSFAYSEDSDAFSFRTVVRRRRDGLVMSGEKSIITGGLQSDALLVYARDEGSGDVVAVLVPRNAPGVSVEPLRPLGVRAAGLGRLTLQDVALPVEALLIDRDALSSVQRFLDRRRVLLCCASVGRTATLIEETVHHLMGSVRYGRRVADMPNVQARLGRMRALQHCAELSLDHALLDIDAEGPGTWSAARSLAKYIATDTGQEIVRLAMGLLGGKGYLDECRLQRDLRDLHGLTAGAGAQEILEADLGMTLVSEVERTLNRGEK